MPEIAFYGASQEVTGSCFLVKGHKTTILVDCGLFQGSFFAAKDNYEPLPFPCGTIDNVLLTHAHLDHSGRLPKLCFEGFVGHIIATEPTLELTRYLWQDALEIMEIDYQQRGKLPLYSPEQAKKATSHFQGISYEKKIKLSKTDYAIFHDAGHILGSAFIELVIDGKRIVFSGDVGNRKPPIIRETTPLPHDIDLLISESTYGDRNHESVVEREKILFSMIDETLKRKGVLMIPAFAIERTQEILYFLNSLREKKVIPPINIFLDSPLAIETTSVFEKFPNYYNSADQLTYKNEGNLFRFPGLVISKTRQQSRQINDTPPPKIIIAGSGMMNGGRITFHLQRYLRSKKNTLFIVGYQARGTLGRKILDGQRTVNIHRKPVPVRAHVHAVGAYSAHADQSKLLSWMKKSRKLKNIALVHGEKETMTVFARAIKKQIKVSARTPQRGETITI